jgi:hypothetical protein
MRAIPAKIADNSAEHMPLFAQPSEPGVLKKFLSHLSWLMVLNLTIKPLYLLVIDAKIQDTLGPEAWGQFFPLLSLSVLLNILLDLGLANHTTRMIAQNPAELNGRFTGGWRAKLWLLPLYLVGLLGIGFLLGYRGDAMAWLAWTGINQALLSAVLYIRSGLQGAGDHIADAWISISDRAILLIAMGVLLWNVGRLSTRVALGRDDGCFVHFFRPWFGANRTRAATMGTTGCNATGCVQSFQRQLALRLIVPVDDDVPPS